VNSERVTLPLREALAEALPERPFHLELWDGTALPATNGAGGPTFRLRSPRALGHLLRAPGQLGLGRAYVSGEIEVDDMDAVLGLLDGYAVPPLDARSKARLAAGAVRAGALRWVPRARGRAAPARATP
jgi:cyclopropane-fatty-acyl-phospholipid synthase